MGIPRRGDFEDFGPGEDLGPGWDPAAREVAGVRDAAMAVATTDGTHQLGQSGGLTLSVRVEGGEIHDWIVTNELEEPVPSQVVVRETTCWKCTKDPKGDIHCWKIRCPKLLDPYEDDLEPI
jgi:hypothetical protein